MNIYDLFWALRVLLDVRRHQTNHHSHGRTPGAVFLDDVRRVVNASKGAINCIEERFPSAIDFDHVRRDERAKREANHVYNLVVPIARRHGFAADLPAIVDRSGEEDCSTESDDGGSSSY